MKFLVFIFFLSFAYINYAMESHALTLSDLLKEIMYKIAACSEPEDRNTCMYVSKYVKDCFALEDSFGKKNYEIIAHSPLKLGKCDSTFFMIYYCDEGNEKIVKNLLENGASANSHAFGVSCLSIALQKGHSHIRDLLLQYRADRKNALDVVSPLAMAVYKGDMKTVDWYWKNNFGFIESSTLNDVPILCVAASRHANMVSYLLSRATYQSFLVELFQKSKAGSDAFHFAAQGGNIRAMELLFKTCDISEKGAKEKTPLHFAAETGKFNAVQFLVERKAEINAVDLCGRTPMWDAITFRIITYLFDHGGRIDIKNKAGCMILHGQIDQKGPLDYIEWLLEKGSPVDAEDNHKKTPLHYAAQKNYGDAVKLLIAHNAKKDVKDSSGKTPLDYASEHKEWDYPLSLLFPETEDKEETVSGFTKIIDFLFDV